MSSTKYLYISILTIITISLISVIGYLINQQNVSQIRIDTLYERINSQTKTLTIIHDNIKLQSEKIDDIINLNNTNSENYNNSTAIQNNTNIPPKNTSENTSSFNINNTKSLIQKSVQSSNSPSKNTLSKNSGQSIINSSNNNLPSKSKCKQAGNFLKLVANKQNSSYEDPYLNVECDDKYFLITSNGIPTFEFKGITPNPLKEQSFKWSIPLNPSIAESITSIPLLGTVAIAIDGLPFFGANEGPPQGYADPFLDEILDYCNGHTAPQGEYHYHAVPTCIIEDYNPIVIGYALDGFEIISPNKNIKSSWKKTSTAVSAWEAHKFVEGSGDLDKCNGKIDSDGIYRYHSTETFPYIIGCYKGIVENIQANNNPNQTQGNQSIQPGSRIRPPNMQPNQMPKKRND